MALGAARSWLPLPARRSQRHGLPGWARSLARAAGGSTVGKRSRTAFPVGPPLVPRAQGGPARSAQAREGPERRHLIPPSVSPGNGRGSCGVPASKPQPRDQHGHLGFGRAGDFHPADEAAALGAAGTAAVGQPHGGAEGPNSEATQQPAAASVCWIATAQPSAAVHASGQRVDVGQVGTVRQMPQARRPNHPAEVARMRCDVDPAEALHNLASRGPAHPACRARPAGATTADPHPARPPRDQGGGGHPIVLAWPWREANGGAGA